MTLNEKLYQCRVRQHLSQTEAAKIIGVGLTLYNQLENGTYKKKLNASTREGISRFLNENQIKLFDNK